MDATREPYSEGYNMYTYVNEELPSLVFSEFSQIDSQRVSITGHSMGGHGALTLVSPRPPDYLTYKRQAGLCAYVHFQVSELTVQSFFATLRNTNLSLLLPRSATQSTVLGARKHFRGILEIATGIYGRNTTRRSW